MKLTTIILASLALLASCRPKPIDIEIPQKPGSLAISSACYDASSVYVSAGYSINSLKKLLDTSTAKELAGLPADMLVDSGLVTIRTAGHAPDTLQKISSGLYGRRDLRLIPGMEYTLLVVDYRKNTTATAVTTFLTQPALDTLYPKRVIRSGDTTVALHLRLNNAAAGQYYFVSYNTPQHMRETAIPLPYNAGSLYTFVPKQLELFRTDDAVNGALNRTITLQVAPTDTILIQFAHIDKAYYDYLAAYKRTGALINQLTGEPINLPTNIVTGLGFFSLYQPVRKMYDLNRH
jgi:hypothetical protein